MRAGIVLRMPFEMFRRTVLNELAVVRRVASFSQCSLSD